MQPVPRFLVAALLVAVVFSGCVDRGTDKDPEPECEDAALCDLDKFLADHHCVKNDLPRVYAPDVPNTAGQIDPWVQGDWWEYSLRFDGKDHGKSKLVYYDIQDNGAHYMVGTPTFEEALDHAVLSTNPVIGRVHKTLYSPHESGSHADMFNFPLCEGLTWKDTFFATSFTFTARATTLTLPGGATDAGFTITGTAADGSKIVHTYSPKAKWFTKIDLDRADGFSVDMDMTGYGKGATGDAYFLRGQQDEALPIARTATTKSNFVERGSGGEGSYDYLGASLDFKREAGNGKVELQLIGPDGAQYACVGLAGSGFGGATQCPAPPMVVSAPFQEGRWEVRLAMPVVPGTEASADVIVASIYDRSGTV